MMPPFWGKNLKNSANLKSERDSELNMVLHPVAISLKKPAAMYSFDDSVHSLIMRSTAATMAEN